MARSAAHPRRAVPIRASGVAALISAWLTLSTLVIAAAALTVAQAETTAPAAPAPSTTATPDPAAAAEISYPSLLRMYDADDNGRLLISEVRKRTTEEFRKRDINLDAYITPDEFQRGFWRIPNVWHEARFKAIDRNHDGRISGPEDFADAEALFNCLDGNHDRVVEPADLERREKLCFRKLSASQPESLASQLAPPVSALLAFDLDRNRVLTAREYQPVIASEFARRDLNRDGSIRLAEFARTEAGSTARAALAAFRRLDIDGNGRLTPAELQPETDRRFRQFDGDGNGVLTETEILLLEQAVAGGQFGSLPGLGGLRVGP